MQIPNDHIREELNELLECVKRCEAAVEEESDTKCVKAE